MPLSCLALASAHAASLAFQAECRAPCLPFLLFSAPKALPELPLFCPDNQGQPPPPCLWCCFLPGFFLKKFRGGACDLNDLPSLDEELYENLRKLRQNPVSVKCAVPRGKRAFACVQWTAGAEAHCTCMLQCSALSRGLHFPILVSLRKYDATHWGACACCPTAGTSAYTYTMSCRH